MHKNENLFRDHVEKMYTIRNNSATFNDQIVDPKFAGGSWMHDAPIVKAHKLSIYTIWYIKCDKVFDQLGLGKIHRNVLKVLFYFATLKGE